MIDDKAARDNIAFLPPLEFYAFVCVWCGAHSDSSTSRFAPCTAPDGDGHLFKRTRIKP